MICGATSALESLEVQTNKAYQAWADVDDILGHQEDERVQLPCNRDCELGYTRAQTRSAPNLPSQTVLRLTVLLAILVVAILIDVEDKRRVDNTWAKCLEQVEEEDTGRE